MNTLVKKLSQGEISELKSILNMYLNVINHHNININNILSEYNIIKTNNNADNTKLIELAKIQKKINNIHSKEMAAYKFYIKYYQSTDDKEILDGLHTIKSTYNKVLLLLDNINTDILKINPFIVMPSNTK